jgi:hypothetical protein
MSLLSTVARPASANPVIVIDYDSVMDRVRPKPMTGGTVHFHIEVTLHDGNKVSQSQTLQSGRLSQDWTIDQNLGESQRSGVWHIESHDTLKYVWNMAQSVRTITVKLLPGNTCSTNVRDQLKPGFSEYAFGARWTSGLEYYSRYENTNMSCSIRQT